MANRDHSAGRWIGLLLLCFLFVPSHPVHAQGRVASTTAGNQVDCLTGPGGSMSPVPSPGSSLGGPFLTLLSCFEEIELRLNALMQPAVSPPPFDKFDTALIALHARATVQIVDYLRSTVMRVQSQGTENERLQLAAADDYISTSLIVDEAQIVIAFMRAGGGEGPTGDPKDGSKPGQAQKEIKEKLKELKDQLKQGIGILQKGAGAVGLQIDEKQFAVLDIIDSILCMLLHIGCE